ncbi:MAG: BREX system ATP-binding protein BrxD [Deltaproteobacteria bacterium]|nr:BREX system ATP-binding protein BrxD [Deltaproteobacteria bacterium]
MKEHVSSQRRDEIIGSLRRGTVPRAGLDAFAVGLERFESTLDAELDAVQRGSAVFKAVRGEYGTGKTFFSRWLQERARHMGFASSEVQISESETPLYRLETIYRRLVENLSTAAMQHGALRSVLDGWFFALEEDLLAEGAVSEADPRILVDRTADLMEQRLAAISRKAPALTAALRAYRQAILAGDTPTAEGLLSWLSGQPNVGASVKRSARIKGEVDHFGAFSFLQGLLVILRDSGHPGLLLVLDEVETLQRMRSDVRDRSLNALRQLIDEVDAGRFPGLYLLITGTPAFFQGPQGMQRLAPLAQRLHVDFGTDARFDNPRAVQIRLPGFDLEKLRAVGSRIRDIYVSHCESPDRVRSLADDVYIASLAASVTGKLGGRVGIAPRIFLKKLVADVLDRIDQFPDFDPRVHYALTIATSEATPVERNAMSAGNVDDVELEL